MEYRNKRTYDVDTMTQTIDLKKFKTLFPGYVDKEIGDDFFIADIHVKGKSGLLEFPCRVDGYVALFCLQGDMDVDVNLRTFRVSRNTLIINVPGNILRVSRHSSDDVRLYLVAMSKDYFSSINVDFNKLFNESMSLLSNPCLVLEKAEVKLLSLYMKTGMEIIASGLGNKREMLGALISSVAYLFSSIWTRHLSDAEAHGPEKNNRATAVFEDFLKLVTEYHSSQRGVSFYADRLYLTPKYLSKLIKSVSGISAPDWINSFIILEAKNMLKYSDLTISEIVYKLHFSSQSVFYKFFKGHTGMTPSEYRKM